MSIAINKKVKFDGVRCFFRHFCVSTVITTAHAHKRGVILHFFSRAFKQKKIKALRPKMTKIASRGSCLNSYTQRATGVSCYYAIMRPNPTVVLCVYSAPPVEDFLPGKNCPSRETRILMFSQCSSPPSAIVLDRIGELSTRFKRTLLCFFCFFLIYIFMHQRRPVRQ